jgi:hypothetical protein
VPTPAQAPAAAATLNMPAVANVIPTRMDRLLLKFEQLVAQTSEQLRIEQWTIEKLNCSLFSIALLLEQ